MSAVRVVFGKWGERPHWEYDAVRLGDDDHGLWLGLPEGTSMARPGARFTTTEPQVVLVPPGAGYVATFFGPGGRAPATPTSTSPRSRPSPTAPSGWSTSTST